ncbi:MAG: DUF5667 domain-containing protein [Chloroflexota bacterium]
MKFFLAYKVLAAVMAVVMGTTAVGGGVALASTDSLPGDALHRVKLAVEDTRLALTKDAAAQAALSLAFAQERATEMEQLMAEGEAVPADTIERMVRHTEQVMAQIAQAQPDQVPGLLVRVVERVQNQERVLEQVQENAPQETQPALQRALQATRRAYETASAGLQDPQQFQHTYQSQYGLEDETGGPHGPNATPTCEDCTPALNQNQEQEREQNQQPDRTPVQGQNNEVTPGPKGNGQESTPEPPAPGLTNTPERPYNEERNENQNTVVTPEGDQIHIWDRDRIQGRTQPTPDRTQGKEQERDQTCTPEPTETVEPAPTTTVEPAPTAEPTQAPPPQPQPTHTPKKQGNGNG